MGINSFFFVFLGGGLGALIRFLISLFIKNSDSGFPISTFFINVLGCFLIGVFSILFSAEGNTIRLFLIIGFLGGFTTFSSFGYETYLLFINGKIQTAFFYIILSNLCGLVAVYSGAKIIKLFV